MRKCPKCPKCEQNDQVIPVLIGMPMGESFEKAERGELHLAGCVTMGGGLDPEWYCKRCEYEFNHHQDWLRMEELIEEHNKQYPDNPVSADPFFLDYGINQIIKIFEDRTGRRVKTFYDIDIIDGFKWKYV